MLELYIYMLYNLLQSIRSKACSESVSDWLPPAGRCRTTRPQQRYTNQNGDQTGPSAFNCVCPLFGCHTAFFLHELIPFLESESLSKARWKTSDLTHFLNRSAIANIANPQLHQQAFLAIGRIHATHGLSDQVRLWRKHLASRRLYG